ncbi:zinc finger protein 79-like [Coccinella septempunctata]|uniref:zinc finger protein 79-like n=1 Tax=Coccinella septempunctata TaxID=41139 RepID=UPI001D0779A1|nr:zinc finger protein 79-like [Coccinella septempunctata]
MSHPWGANFYVDNFRNNELSSIEPCIKLEVNEEERIDVTMNPLPVGVEIINQRSVSQQVKQSRKKKTTVNPDVVKEESRSCTECGKVLASAASLYVHLKSHSSNKPYICGECGANFTRKYYLEVHQRTHTGERPFKCDICEKYFSQKSSLNTHKRRHTGEKPYECLICDKTFSAQSYLASHQWTHYQKVNGVFTCNGCDLNFVSRNLFVQHIRTHLKELKYECEHCTKRFAKESYLIRHKNGAHLGDA